MNNTGRAGAHAHSHAHDHAITGGSLRAALILTVIILLVEVVAGIRANSLALLSDAGHILTDVFSLGLAWFAIALSSRPANSRNTFGYGRGTILAALANATALILVTIAVSWEAIGRLRHPQNVSGGIIIVAALLAVAVNAYIASTLHGHENDNLNVRAALLHVVGDMAASVGVIVAGIAISLWHATLLDPLLSIAIAVLIAYGAWQVIRDTVFILMESTPKGMDLETIEAAMLEVPGVEGVHDLHVWALSDGYRLLSAHVRVPEQTLGETSSLLTDLKLLLHRRFHIEHATIELECVDCSVPYARPITLFPKGSIAPAGGSVRRSNVGEHQGRV